MEKVGLHIKDGKITTDDGKELLLVYVDALERLQEQLNEANEVIKDYIFHEYLTPETYEMRNKLEVYCKKYKIGEESGV